MQDNVAIFCFLTHACLEVGDQFCSASVLKWTWAFGKLSSSEGCFDMTKHLSSAQFLDAFKTCCLASQTSFLCSSHLARGFVVLTCHAFAGILAYVHRDVEITQASKWSGYLWCGSRIANEWPAQWVYVFWCNHFIFPNECIQGGNNNVSVSASKELIIMLV